MKKFIFILSIFSILFFNSCSDGGDTDNSGKATVELSQTLTINGKEVTFSYYQVALEGSGYSQSKYESGQNVVFTGLNPGNYAVTVKAVTNSGTVAAVGSSLIKINPRRNTDVSVSMELTSNEGTNSGSGTSTGDVSKEDSKDGNFATGNESVGTSTVNKVVVNKTSNSSTKLYFTVQDSDKRITVNISGTNLSSATSVQVKVKNLTTGKTYIYPIDSPYDNEKITATIVPPSIVGEYRLLPFIDGVALDSLTIPFSIVAAPVISAITPTTAVYSSIEGQEFQVKITGTNLQYVDSFKAMTFVYGTTTKVGDTVYARASDIAEDGTYVVFDVPVPTDAGKYTVEVYYGELKAKTLTLTVNAGAQITKSYFEPKIFYDVRRGSYTLKIEGNNLKNATIQALYKDAIGTFSCSSTSEGTVSIPVSNNDIGKTLNVKILVDGMQVTENEIYLDDYSNKFQPGDIITRDIKNYSLEEYNAMTEAQKETLDIAGIIASSTPASYMFDVMGFDENEYTWPQTTISASVSGTGLACTDTIIYKYSFPLFKWIKEIRETADTEATGVSSWFIPNVSEMQSYIANRSAINQTMNTLGKNLFDSEKSYWMSTLEYERTSGDWPKYYNYNYITEGDVTKKINYYYHTYVTSDITTWNCKTAYGRPMFKVSW